MALSKKQGLAKAYCKMIELELSHYTLLKSQFNQWMANPLLVDSLSLIELERRLKAIEWTLESLEQCQDPRKRIFVQLKYFEGKKTDLEIQQQLFIEQATFYRWRLEVIHRIAQQLGLGWVA